jgi:hypothetical protein
MRLMSGIVLGRLALCIAASDLQAGDECAKLAVDRARARA